MKKNDVFSQVRSAIGRKVKKVAENFMRDGDRVLKVVVLSGKGRLAYVTKELVLSNGTSHWRNLGAYLV